ncbi:hypothetical protein ACFQ49_15350 [Kroppenstedtia eburnea]|uniref:hypothetical protein n=1 Tax=Kroppenstedtia eburnea TaxID=714067 RepID=UPI00363E15BC
MIQSVRWWRVRVAMWVPEMVVREELRQGRWRPANVEGISFRRPISLCFREGAELFPLRQSFGNGGRRKAGRELLKSVR